MKQLYLLDAYALIYRAYYAFSKSPRLDSRGNNTSAIFGFINTLGDILSSFQPEYLAVVFDPPGGSFRSDFYPDYKANRSETPEAISYAVPYIKQFLRAMRIPALEVPRYEADDVIGTLAHQAAEFGHEVLMVTPDKDYGQLVTPLISILAPQRGGGYEELGVREVCQRHGIADPRQVIDILGITGDSVDNIPGIAGIGPVGAEKLIAAYGSLEAVLEAADEIPGKLGEHVRAGRERALLSKRLATIALDAPITLDMEACRRELPDMPAVRSLLTQLELRQQLARMERLYDSPEAPQPSARKGSSRVPEKAPALSETRPEPHQRVGELPDKRHNLLDMADALAQLRALLPAEPEVFVYGLLQEEQRLIALALICSTTDDVYYLPTEGAGAELLAPLMALLAEHPRLVGYDLKRLYYALAPEVTYPQGGERTDLLLVHYLLMPEMNHSLAHLSARYLGLTLTPYEALGLPKLGQELALSSTAPEQLGAFASERVFALKHLYRRLMPELEERQQRHLLREVEMPLLPVLLEMELRGVRIDRAELERQGGQMLREMAQLEAAIHALAGTPFNVSSPRQVGELLFDTLGLDAKAKKTKGGAAYTTSEEVLEKYRDKHPIVGKILEHRHLKKLYTTYVAALPELCDAEGRLHTTFNQASVATGRLSSSNPNLQNIPIRTALGREIRAAFVPNEGDILLSADYSQIELRLMAHFSEDAHLIEAFQAGLDIHTATAARIAAVPTEEVTADMRRQAKTANFGIIYGISAFGLAERLGISRSEAKQLIEGYFASYPGVSSYMQRVVQEARQRGYVETLLGRRRYLPDINSQNAVVRGYAERNAINAPLQGTAADLIKMAMITIAQTMKARGLRSQLLLQVHDELNFSVPPAELDEMIELVQAGMQAVGRGLRVPLEVGIGHGPNWLAAH